ncbi:MAG TPA: hypothetical protein VII61_06670 [Ktedonobacteraceae bacterium]
MLKDENWLLIKMNTISLRVAERAGLQRCPELDTEHIVFASGWASIDGT